MGSSQDGSVLGAPILHFIFMVVFGYYLGHSVWLIDSMRDPFDPKNRNFRWATLPKYAHTGIQ